MMSDMSNKDFFGQVTFKDYDDAFLYNNSIDEKIAADLINQKILNPPVKYKSTTEQGNALEEVVDYFLKHSGFVQDTARNKKNRIHDLDHVGYFGTHMDEVVRAFKLDGSKILGESKNYYDQNRLKVDIVYKVEGLKKLVNASVACYFTREGLTGTHKLEGGKAVAFQFNAHHRNTCSIVFTDKDWSFLAKHPKKFGVLFKAKLQDDSNQIDSELTVDSLSSD